MIWTSEEAWGSDRDTEETVSVHAEGRSGKAGKWMGLRRISGSNYSGGLIMGRRKAGKWMGLRRISGSNYSGGLIMGRR